MGIKESIQNTKDDIVSKFNDVKNTITGEIVKAELVQYIDQYNEILLGLDREFSENKIQLAEQAEKITELEKHNQSLESNLKKLSVALAIVAVFAIVSLIFSISAG